MRWSSYAPRDEHHDGYVEASGSARPECRTLLQGLGALGPEGLRQLSEAARVSLLNQGITFSVHSDPRGGEKILPFDPLPRIVSATDWDRIERGIEQRVRALNLFLADIYGPQCILKDRAIPTEVIVQSPGFSRAVCGLRPPADLYIHVAGTDLIQDETGRFLVLEDNVRIPSGVSYLIENRIVMARILPDLLRAHRVRRVDTYPQLLLDALLSLTERDSPRVAVLTPGPFNAAYFEHGFLAAQMGVSLVEGADLVVDNEALHVRTTEGLKRIDVLYRRVDEAFIDPVTFRTDSLLGVPGLMHACRAGNLALANACGTGIADDKALYAYVPRLISYYLGEEPLLAQVPTYLCRDATECAYVLDHLEELVVKLVDGAGGHGMLIGTESTAAERATMRDAIRAHPERYIAQPVQRLSTLPTLSDAGDRLEIQPCHVDLRPFAVCRAGGEIEVLPGGLTRVAMEPGCLVVNSSRGGGSKDTWVLHAGDAEGA